MKRWESIDELEIAGAASAIDRIRELLYGVVLRGTRPPMPVMLHVIEPGLYFEGEDFSITAFPVHHRGAESLGYAFEEKGRRPFLPEKAETLGIPPGPWRRDLVDGHPATLPDGRVIQPEEVLGEFHPGTRLVVIGDSGETDSLVEYCRGADALIIESTYLDEEADMAKQFGHLTARRSADLAVRAGVGQLLLTHISRRYREKDVQQEAQDVFPNSTVARDFDAFQIKRCGE